MTTPQELETLWAVFYRDKDGYRLRDGCRTLEDACKLASNMVKTHKVYIGQYMNYGFYQFDPNNPPIISKEGK